MIGNLTCGVISFSGAEGEPLACGYWEGHDGPHAWASLPWWKASDLSAALPPSVDVPDDRGAHSQLPGSERS